MKNKKTHRLVILILFNLSILGVALLYNLLFEEKLLTVFSVGCAFKNAFGIYCPGCGGSRSLNALLNFRLLRSFIYYPAIPYTAAVILLFDIDLLFALIKGRGLCGRFYYKAFLGVPIIIMANFLLKNILLLAFGVDLLNT